MLTRTQKQLVIGGVYILVAAIIAGGVYWSKYRPTCSDGIKNGKEEAVDCGTLACGKECAAPVQALVIQDVQLAKTPAGDFDMAATVYNPNTQFGADMVNYDLVVTDSNGEVRRSGTFYILAGQTKSIVRTSLRDIPDNASARMEVKSVEWVKTSGDPETYIILDREAYTLGADKTVYEVVVVNTSDYDFDTVDITVVAKDSSGKVIATNMTNLKTFLSQTERSAKVSWPFALPENVQVQAEANTNIFNNANYIRRNGTQEKFQQYY